ncbi:MAG: chemotaxis protein CheA [Lachnospiraceae bacterium]|nr:chemotaxis protein CheA [Lachnospiraceae bacterium]
MDTGQYLGVFLDEAKEHLQALNDSIMQLEEEPENADCINEIFRAAHSMKGMAGTMGYKRMQDLTHHIEDVFSDVRNGEIKINSDMVDTLLQCVDAVQAYVDNITETQDEGTEENEHLIKALADIRASKDEGGGDAAPAAEAAQEAPAAAEADMVDPSDDSPAWTKVKLEPAVREHLEESLKEGKKVIGMTVHVLDSCVLKAARAFLVFKGLEEIGEIAMSEPSTQDIEDERFDNSFSLLLITEETPEKATEIAKDVSEIEKVETGEFDVASAKSTEEEEPAAAAPAPAEAKAEEKPKEAAKPKEETMPAPVEKQAPAAPAGGQGAKKPAGKPVVNRTVRVDIEKLDAIMNQVSELIIAKNSLISTANSANTGNNPAASAIQEKIEYLENVTTELHESVMKVRMVPLENTLQKFPRMIRDLNKSLGKPMELTMTGEDTEMDRTVVDEIGDPLMHLLRNSADHGIESLELRRERGKPDTGEIFLHAYQDGNNVVIEIGDDGNGIDAEVVKNKAIEKGVVTPEQAQVLTEQQCVELLFAPGFSTAKVISEISGRGVGLDVVKSKVESLNGEVSVKTKLGEGSTWTIRLPLTLAIIQALMVVVGGEKYAIPLDSIQTIEDVDPAEIKLVSNKEVITLRGNVCPLVRMNEMLDNETTRDPEENMVVVVVRKGDQQAGLIIDELIGQLGIVIKPLGKYTSKARFLSGATILGDGEIALIRDPNALI